MKRTIELTLEKARELFGKTPEMDELLLANFSEKELTNKMLPKSWGSIFTIEGCYISECSEIHAIKNKSTSSLNKNLFATEKQAQSALAAAQLSQLMKVYNCDWVADWSDPTVKTCIRAYADTLDIVTFSNVRTFLAFPTYAIAKEFLNNFEDLIKQYYEL